MSQYSVQERLISAIGYIGILFLIPMFFHNGSAFAKFHAKQGLALFIAWALNAVIMLIPVLGWIVGFFISIFLFVVAIIAILKAYAGEKWEISFATKIIEKLHL